MYFLAEEQMEIERAVYSLRSITTRQVTGFRWFPGWDSPIVQHAACRAYCSDMHRLGDSISNALLTATAKLASVVQQDDRWLVLTDFPTRGVASSIRRMARVYVDRVAPSYAGAWIKQDNEFVVAALIHVAGRAVTFPRALFTTLVADTRAQLSKDQIGTCRCGIRRSNTNCAVCGE